MFKRMANVNGRRSNSSLVESILTHIAQRDRLVSSGNLGITLGLSGRRGLYQANALIDHAFPARRRRGCIYLHHCHDHLLIRAIHVYYHRGLHNLYVKLLY